MAKRVDKIVLNGTDYMIGYSAGTNVQISSNNVISATDTKYQSSDFDIKDLSDSTGLKTQWTGKQDALTSGTNIKTINNQSLLDSGDLVIKEVPSGGSTGQVLTKTSGGYGWENPGGGIVMLPGSPNTIAYERVGTQAQYEALGTYRSDTRYTVF